MGQFWLGYLISAFLTAYIIYSEAATERPTVVWFGENGTLQCKVIK